MTTIAPAFEKTITPEYDRSDPRRPRTEYRAELDGQFVGYYKNHHYADVALDQLIYELIQSGACASAAQLDGGSDVEDVAADMAEQQPICGKSLCGQPGIHNFLLFGGPEWACCKHYQEDILGGPCECEIIRPGEWADDVLVAFCASCGDELEGLARKGSPSAYCPACRESGEAALPTAEVNRNSAPALTLPQAVALACGEPSPVPAPQGPEEQTNYGGWRAPIWIGG